MPKNRVRILLILLYACAALQFVRFYVQSTTFYLSMDKYLAGRERLPFQERVFPILFLKPLTESTWVRSHLAHSTGAFTPERGPFYLLSLVALVVAAIYTQRLYEVVSTHHAFGAVVFPVFLFTVIWTYAIHSEANFAYPYDFSSLAFFTAGLYYIYRRRFLPLLIVIFIGTFNRETTLFLIGLYTLDAVSSRSDAGVNSPRFNLRLLPWLRMALLSALWLSVKLFLAHQFRHNDASENFLRIHDNLHQLKPRLAPALLNVCGYLLPVVLIFRRYLEPHRFRNYLWILPLWFSIMFCSGVLVETRIYGELCSFTAVAVVLILENYARANVQPTT